MKQIELLIENLESRFRIKIDDFIHLYEQKVSGEAICEALGITENGLRVITRTLNLRLPKKHRQHDMSLMRTRFGDSEVNQKLSEVANDLDASYKNELKLERQLLQVKRELGKYKSMALHQSTELDLEEVRIAVLESVRPVRPVNVQVRTPSNHYADHTQFILLSDLHCEEIVSSKDVGMVNEYNWEEFERRLDKVFSESLQAYRGERKCILLSLGDNISGIIHSTLETTSKYTGEAVADLAKLLAHYTNILATVYDEVEVLCVTGNHSRLSEHKKSNANGFNLEYLLFKIWEAMTTNDNVQFNFGTSGYVYTKVGGKYLAGCHGDLLKPGSGITRTLKTQEIVRQTLGITPNHVFQGHLHTPSLEQTPNGGTYLVNGSLIGPNSYTHSNGFVGLPWSQTIGSFLPNGDVENVRLVCG